YAQDRVREPREVGVGFAPVARAGRPDPQYRGAESTRTVLSLSMPRATQAIIGANVVVFLLQLQMGGAAIAWFALWPLGTSAATGGELGFEPWQLVTYGFL